MMLCLCGQRSNDPSLPLTEDYAVLLPLQLGLKHSAMLCFGKLYSTREYAAMMHIQNCSCCRFPWFYTQ